MDSGERSRAMLKAIKAIAATTNLQGSLDLKDASGAKRAASVRRTTSPDGVAVSFVIN